MHDHEAVSMSVAIVKKLKQKPCLTQDNMRMNTIRNFFSIQAFITILLEKDST